MIMVMMFWHELYSRKSCPWSQSSQASTYDSKASLSLTLEGWPRRPRLDRRRRCGVWAFAPASPHPAAVEQRATFVFVSKAIWTFTGEQTCSNKTRIKWWCVKNQHRGIHGFWGPPPVIEHHSGRKAQAALPFTPRAAVCFSVAWKNKKRGWNLSCVGWTISHLKQII